MSPELRYFEDFSSGDVIDLGSQPVGEAEMADFNARYDPGLHSRPDRTKVVDRPVAGGWFVGAVTMKLLVEGFLNRCAAEGSSGLEDLVFAADVEAGDRLSSRYTVLEVAPSPRRPEIGKVRARIETFNQRGERVLSMEATQFLRRRPS